MIKLIKGARVFSPEYMGIKDVLIVGGKIAAIEDNILLEKNPLLEIEVIEAQRKILVPGFIDAHVHIIGGGGEGGYKTRTPEIKLSDITRGGVTTIIGCLGTDGITRTMEALLAKARALEEEGVSTYIYTGSYRLPLTTITGDVMKDIMVVDKIIGAGEVAISDHRSSQPSLDELKKLAADVRVGGILSGKAGVVNLHLGDGQRMLDMVFNIIENTEIPFTQFLPTHMNRNIYLFKEGIRFAKAGGFIDFTTSSKPILSKERETKASKCLRICLDEGVEKDKVLFTSDGQGSLPMFNEKKEFIGLGIGRVTSLFEEVRDAVNDDGVPLEDALRVITANPAAALRLRGKGKVEKGFDGDIVILDENLKIDTVIARGRTMLSQGEVKVFGTFEQ